MSLLNGSHVWAQNWRFEIGITKCHQLMKRNGSSSARNGPGRVRTSARHAPGPIALEPAGRARSRPCGGFTRSWKGCVLSGREPEEQEEAVDHGPEGPRATQPQHAAADPRPATLDDLAGDDGHGEGQELEGGHPGDVPAGEPPAGHGIRLVEP